MGQFLFEENSTCDEENIVAIFCISIVLSHLIPVQKYNNRTGHQLKAEYFCLAQNLVDNNVYIFLPHEQL